MRNALILHGKPSEERYRNPGAPKPHEANWLPWLGRELGKRGIESSIPAFPRPYFPVYEDWRSLFERFHVDERTGVVGHSAGAEFILRWTSENPNNHLETLALIAPYRDEARKYGHFSAYELDPGITERIGRIIIFNSLDDSEPIQRNARLLAEVLRGAELIELDGFGHFMFGNNMKTTAFPELLDALTK